MKKVILLTMFYTIFAMLSDLLYKSLISFYNFTGSTILRVIEIHILILGTLFFLFVILMINKYNINLHKNFNKFYIIYNVGFGIMLFIFFLKGILQIILPVISDLAFISMLLITISAHVIVIVGFIYLFFIIKDQKKTKNNH